MESSGHPQRQVSFEVKLGDSKMGQGERIKTLEDVAAHLNNQMKIMKKLMSAQINEIKKLIEDQACDVREMIIEQDKAHNDRMEDLESKVSKLTSELSKQALKSARKTSVSAQPFKVSLHSPGAKGIEEEEFTKVPPRTPIQLKMIDFNESWNSPNDKPIMTPHMTPIQRITESRLNEDTVDQDRITQDTEYVLNIYQETSQMIFNFYTDLFMGFSKVRRTLNKTQFTKFFLNCNLNTQTGYELMWIKILRQLNITKTNHASEQVGKELTLEQFEHALVIIAREIYKDNGSMTEAQKVEAFLIAYVLPNVTPKHEIHHAEDEFHETPTIVNKDKIFKKHRKLLSSLYNKYSAKKKSSSLRQKNNQFNMDYGLSVKELVNFCQEHGVLRLITKKDLAHIHATRSHKTKKGEDLLSYEAFEDALVAIATTVYSAEPFKNHYPSTESKLEKLLTKINLTNHELTSESFKDSFRES